MGSIQEIRGSSGDYSGYSISLSSDGTIIAIGSEGNQKVRIYEKNAQLWELRDTITSTRSYAGYRVALSSDGSTLVVTTNNEYITDTITNTNSIVIYKYTDNEWVFQREIFGEDENYIFGQNISINHDGQIVAALNTTDKGSIRIFKTVHSDNLTELTKYEGTDGTTETSFKLKKMKLNDIGNTIIVSNSEITKVINRSTYTQIGSDITSGGYAIDINSNGTIIAVSDPSNNEGIVKVYEINNDNDHHVSQRHVEH